MDDDVLAAIRKVAEGVQPKIEHERQFIKEIMPVPDVTLLHLKIAEIEMAALSEICSILNISVEVGSVGMYYGQICIAREAYEQKIRNRDPNTSHKAWSART